MDAVNVVIHAPHPDNDGTEKSPVVLAAVPSPGETIYHHPRRRKWRVREVAHHTGDDGPTLVVRAALLTYNDDR